VTASVPAFAGTPEPVEAIALVSKAAELLGVLLVLPLRIASAASPPTWQGGRFGERRGRWKRHCRLARFVSSARGHPRLGGLIPNRLRCR